MPSIKSYKKPEAKKINSEKSVVSKMTSEKTNLVKNNVVEPKAIKTKTKSDNETPVKTVKSKAIKGAKKITTQKTAPKIAAKVRVATSQEKKSTDKQRPWQDKSSSKGQDSFLENQAELESNLDGKVSVSEFNAESTSENKDNHEHIEENMQNEEHVSFCCDQWLKDKNLKAYEFTHSVVKEWVNDGSFESLPIENVYAHFVVKKALTEAKKVEKKLEEKGFFLITKMGFEFLKSKIQTRV